MMKIELLSNSKFTTSGSSVLKMMQNNSTPSLDLIVRESIQNSIDAVLPNQSEVKMQFIYNKFNANDLVPFFEDIDDVLSKRYGNTTQKYIAIRDQNTYGLTGDLSGNFRPGDKNQNLGKLVFHIMKPQDKEGAGGSWGIGKTVYYRIGIGLVIYYSRVKLDNGCFQERLVATLVENENNKDGLLSSKANNLGVAFFGDLLNDGKTVTTIIDENKIRNLLGVFNIPPLVGANTGTTIVIPFIDEKKLLSNNSIEDNQKNWWEDNIEQYLNVSILRWYFPRMCSNYPIEYGPKLIVYINYNKVEVDEINTPIFKKYSELYNACYSQNYSSWIKKVAIKKQRNVENEVIGYFAYGKITKQELKMITNRLPSPYKYCLLEDEMSKHSPIIAFTRKPGMIVNYGSEEFAIGNEKDDYILGVFSLNSSNKVISKSKSLNLDEYIRQSEKSDHTSWSDHEITTNANKVLIVRSIYNGIKKELNNSYGEQVATTGEISINKNFAKKFGKLLLPDESFGNAASGILETNKGNRAGGGLIHTRKQNKIEFIRRKFCDSSIVLEYKFTLKNGVKNILAINCINTINGGIHPIKYEETGLKYPCEIQKIFCRIEQYNQKKVNKIDVKPLLDIDVIGDYSFSFCKTKSEKKYGFKLEASNNALPITFSIRLRIDTIDKLLSTYFDFIIEEF